MKSRLIVVFIFFGFSVYAQQELSLENLNDFKEQSGNWQIVGEVIVNRKVDVYHHETEEDVSKSKKKRRKKKSKVEIPKAFTFTSGTGILLNYNEGGKKDALISKWEHGDIKLELEVLIPKGSNSGIYLQGRYELQIKDSWGVKNPKISDMGGIHNNWETDEDKIFRGISPSSNASKAPGLWQKYEIHFQAPRFDKNGQKIKNAKFISVKLNGVQIHSNAEVPHCTGGPLTKEEVPYGPLMIQGNHGPVAIRNFKYQLLKESSVLVNNLSYKIYKGDFKGLEDLEGQKVSSSGLANKIDIKITEEEDKYGVVYTGIIEIDEEDNYTIQVGYSGGVKLVVDSDVLIENNSSSAQGDIEKTVKLSKGSHYFVLTNIKSAAWRRATLGMFIKSESTNSKAFHVYDSYPSRISSVSPIFVDAEAKPRLLRGFVAFKGDGTRLSHTVGVGAPSGVNFIYDLSSANLIGAWRGDFIDATPMWHNRGDGSFRARGSVQWTFLNQSIAQLEESKSAFPKTGSAPDFVSKGYSIDQESGLPIFKHEYKGIEIENKIIIDKSNTYIIRQVSFSKTGMSNWYLKLAEGEVQKTLDGEYVINNQEYYINILSGQTPIIREVEGVKELVILVDGSKIKYELIW